MNDLRIGLIGYGEVGRIFTAGLKPASAWTGAWDLKFADPARQAEPLAHAAAAGIVVGFGVDGYLVAMDGLVRKFVNSAARKA